jgi:hypothetical protein
VPPDAASLFANMDNTKNEVPVFKKSLSIVPSAKRVDNFSSKILESVGAIF